MSEEKRTEVRAFLRSFKKAAQERGINFIPRAEFRDAKIELGFTNNNCAYEILTLTVDDYCQGPDPDDDRPGDIWVFGKDVGGIEIYIKLKLAPVEEGTIAKCISFHPARFPLVFPLKHKRK